jgi:ribosomal protein S12 methylthiotransferase
MVSLGCSKNLVDSERLLASALESLSAKVTDKPEDADLILLNTCAFIRKAEEEAMERILSLRSALKTPGAKLVVLGCLPARHPKELGDLAELCDLVLPFGAYEGFGEALSALMDGDARPGDEGRDSSKDQELEKPIATPLSHPKASLQAPSPSPSSSPSLSPSLSSPSPLSFERGKRLVSTPFYRAYLKVAEGCDHRCSFCIIPKLRGKFISRGIGELKDEALELSRGGAIELTLVAQDLFSYRDGDSDIRDLCMELSRIKTLRWIRLMYAHPDSITEELILDLKDIKGLLPYLDIPFQHASQKVLGLMGRKPRDPMILINMLRRVWPGLALRATLMTGFPGEEEEDFIKLYDFLKEAKLENAGFFKFSPEEGTRAYRLPDRPARLIADKRFKKLSSLQRKISHSILKDLVGKEIEVLTEGYTEDNPYVISGRASFQAPEVDGMVYFEGNPPEIGSINRVRVIKAGHYDLIVSLPEEKSLSWK